MYNISKIKNMWDDGTFVTGTREQLLQLATYINENVSDMTVPKNDPDRFFNEAFHGLEEWYDYYGEIGMGATSNGQLYLCDSKIAGEVAIPIADILNQ